MQMCVEYYEKIIENPPKKTMTQLEDVSKKRSQKITWFFRCFFSKESDSETVRW